MNKKINIAILGSTGSIGRQTLEVVAMHKDLFQVELLTANNNSDLLIKQAVEFDVNTVVITNDEKYLEVEEALFEHGIKVFSGLKSVEFLVAGNNIDVVVAAMVGFSGLTSVIAAIKAGKKIALANKETMVVAGEIIQKLSQETNSMIIPVDSEHSAILQCLAGENQNKISKVYLTASGGPFRTLPKSEFEKITVEQALNHPKWNMGDKISIDSATLMNKGLEAIEAKWFFNLQANEIEVVIHPESVIHSMVKFLDGSVKAQLGNPDMRVPIKYALLYPYRISPEFDDFDIFNYPNLSFEKPDFDKFPLLKLSFFAMEKSGVLPCVLNASNEIAVSAFLSKKIKFTDISKIVSIIVEKSENILNPNLEDLINIDKETRIKTLELVKKN